MNVECRCHICYFLNEIVLKFLDVLKGKSWLFLYLIYSLPFTHQWIRYVVKYALHRCVTLHMITHSAWACIKHPIYQHPCHFIIWYSPVPTFCREIISFNSINNMQTQPLNKCTQPKQSDCFSSLYCINIGALGTRYIVTYCNCRTMKTAKVP